MPLIVGSFMVKFLWAVVFYFGTNLEQVFCSLKQQNATKNSFFIAILSCILRGYRLKAIDFQ